MLGETTHYQATEKGKNKWQVTITLQEAALTHPPENLGVFTTQQIAQAFRWNPEVIRR